MLKVVSGWIRQDIAQQQQQQPRGAEEGELNASEVQEYCVYFANQQKRAWPWLFMRRAAAFGQQQPQSQQQVDNLVPGTAIGAAAAGCRDTVDPATNESGTNQGIAMGDSKAVTAPERQGGGSMGALVVPTAAAATGQEAVPRRSREAVAAATVGATDEAGSSYTADGDAVAAAAVEPPVSAAGESGGAIEGGNVTAAGVMGAGTGASDSFTMWLKPQSPPAAAAAAAGVCVGDGQGDESSTISSFGPLHGGNDAGGVGLEEVHCKHEPVGSESAAVAAGDAGVTVAADDYSSENVSGGSGGKLRRQLTQTDGQRLSNGVHEGLEQQQQAVQSQHVAKGYDQTREGARGSAEHFWRRSQETRRVLPSPRTSYDTRRYSSDCVLPVLQRPVEPAPAVPALRDSGMESAHPAAGRQMSGGSSRVEDLQHTMSWDEYLLLRQLEQRVGRKPGGLHSAKKHRRLSSSSYEPCAAQPGAPAEFDHGLSFALTPAGLISLGSSQAPMHSMNSTSLVGSTRRSSESPSTGTLQRLDAQAATGLLLQLPMQQSHEADALDGGSTSGWQQHHHNLRPPLGPTPEVEPQQCGANGGGSGGQSGGLVSAAGLAGELVLKANGPAGGSRLASSEKNHHGGFGAARSVASAKTLSGVVLGGGPMAALNPSHGLAGGGVRVPLVAPLPDVNTLQNLRVGAPSVRGGAQSTHGTEKSAAGFRGEEIGLTCAAMMSSSWLWARQLLVHDLGTFK
jgi:hypothetical protein